MSAYSRGRPFAKCDGNCALIHTRDVEGPGRIVVLDNTVKRVSPRLYFKEINSSLNGSGTDQTYTIDAKIVGEHAATNELALSVNRQQLWRLDEKNLKDREIMSLIEAAMPITKIPPAKQWMLAASILTLDDSVLSAPDEPSIVGRTCDAILRRRGTWHNFHGETQNMGRHPNTADFFINGIVGFATYGDAEAAYADLYRLPFDEIKVVRLYKSLSEAA